ncbi:fluoride efflux transporter CrcB [Psychrobacillus sp. NPDC058041]|uniref:fluoride efflux transporter CrcB n=1 Tax=Psychrobacillus sp. NPDC058041 TaxID=3346310 RepID=UPI0036D8ACBC
MTALVTVAIGGFLGAILRFYFAQKLNENVADKIPIGTLFVNLIGSYLLGFIVSVRLDEIYILLIGTGFLGAFTTFSTLNKELITLQKFPRKWILYFLITYIGGLCLAFLGYFIGK